VRCKSSEDHKSYKRYWEQNLNTSDEQGEGLPGKINKWEQAAVQEIDTHGGWGIWS
jgi:hypothetical protein